MSPRRRFPWFVVLLVLLAVAATLAKGEHDRAGRLAGDLAALEKKADRLESELDNLYPARIERDALVRKLAARDGEIAGLEAELAAARDDLARARAERDGHLMERLALARRLEDALSALSRSNRE